MKASWDGWAWVSKITPVVWKKYLRNTRGHVELAFNPEGADENTPPTPTQIATAERISSDRKLVESVLDAIQQRHANEIGKQRLEKVIALQNVFVQPLARDGIAFVGFGFSADWDDEHGLGILTHGTRVLEVGGADVAFLMWIAERHAKRTPGKRKAPGTKKAKPAATKARPASKKQSARKASPRNVTHARKTKAPTKKPARRRSR